MGAQQLRKRDALHVFHDEVGGGSLHFEVVHGDDVRIAEHGGRARLVESGDVGERALGHEVFRCGIEEKALAFRLVKAGKGRVLRRGGGSARGSARRTGARRRDGSARGHRVRGGLAQQGRIIPRRAPVSGLRQRWGTVRTKTHVRAGIRPLGTHGVEFVQLDAFDGHLALDARVPRHLHRAEPAGARFRDRPVAVQYELLMSHDASCAFPVVCTPKRRWSPRAVVRFSSVSESVRGVPVPWADFRAAAL